MSRFHRPDPPDVSFRKVIDTDVTHTLVIDKDVQAHAFVINNIGDAEADATASGRNTLAENSHLLGCHGVELSGPLGVDLGIGQLELRHRLSSRACKR